ncbi:MAG: hypothetical protein HOH82_11805 [Planctomycetaceae bacterium]|jgi:hypothetical protein|nr:hypothetical protein [Planctomycetaceae bacterium]
MPKPIKLPLKKQKAFQRLQELLQQSGRHDLLWYHRVGQEVNRLYPADDRGYGESHMPTLAEALGKSASYADTLWKSRLFWNEYERSEVRSLCKAEAAGGFVLTWSHMQSLLSLDDEDRPRFQEDCLNAEWPCKELHRRIKESREPQGQGGRRFQKPKDVETALRQLINESRTWDRRYHEVWFELDEPAIRLETGKGKSEDVAELATEAVKVLKTLQSDIEDCLPRLKALTGKRKKVGRRAKKRG